MRTKTVIAGVVVGAIGAGVAVRGVLGRRKSSGTATTARVTRSMTMARTGAGAAASYVATQAKKIGADQERRAELDAEFHAKTAERAAATMGQMKGAMMKIGQMLSFIDTGLPEPYKQALSALQADAPPMDADTVRWALEQELSDEQLARLTEFDPEPLASASIGQVHTAVLDGARPVVIKIQYPGVDDALKSDLDNAEMLNRMMKLVFPNFDPAPVTEELRERIGEELDYRIERGNLELFGELFADHPFIKIPVVVPDMSTQRVITMDRVDGLRWADALTAPKALQQRWAEVLFRFVFGTLNRFHVFNGDPHPGNYLFHEDGTITFLDFGCVRRFDAATSKRQADLERAVIDEDADALLDELLAFGFLDPGHPLEPDRVLAWFRQWNAPVLADEIFTYTPEFAEAAVKANFDPSGEWGDLQKHFKMPREFVFLNRINLGLNSILAQLSATGNWHRIVAEYMEQAPAATLLGEMEQAHMVARGERQQ
ncbi:MAG: AarF/ABC1/UbiB kinase family protein [Acidimicrobiia bacterium]|nr:AarF/ABC1/UbiB kinase family protein [Acidimicrobiia bacterium]